MDVQILLNGAAHAVATDATVADLVSQLGLLPEQVAVERNERLVPRRAHAETTLQAGDRVEVVTLVGGG